MPPEPKSPKMIEKNDRLKTLKDFRVYIRNIVCDELKAEAVKWIESLNKTKEIKGYDNQEVVRFIKHFFNLTEEDLK